MSIFVLLKNLYCYFYFFASIEGIFTIFLIVWKNIITIKSLNEHYQLSNSLNGILNFLLFFSFELFIF
jgi:hypothetical protein